MAFGDLINEFSWSPSRDRAFHGCRRAYWWRYYGHWNGWKATAPVWTRIAYRLGKLDTLDTWAGSIVHDLLEVTMKNAALGHAPEAGNLSLEARRRLRQGWVESRDGHWVKKPKAFVNLWEHYYGSEDDRSPERTEAIRERVNTSLTAALDGPWADRLMRLGTSCLRNIEVLDSITVAGHRVWVKPDLAYDDSGITHLVDWKTGRPKEEDRFQVRSYAMLAGEKWQVPPERCAGALVYLGRNEVQVVEVTTSELEEAKARMVASMTEMRAPLRDPAANLALPEDFPRTSDTAECAHCNFRQLCYGGADVPGARLAGDPADAAPVA